MISLFDQHTHRLESLPGKALVNLPMEVLEDQTHSLFKSLCCQSSGDKNQTNSMYSSGIFPLYEGDFSQAWQNLQYLAPYLSAIGECGLDHRSSMPAEEQEYWYILQLQLAHQLQKPLIIHCVGAWHQLLKIARQYPTDILRIVHGFRGNPELARQLLDAGFHLSFGEKFNVDALRICPSSCRHIETDASSLSIQQIAELQAQSL